MKLGMVDTSRNRFLSLRKTLDVLDNKSISEISNHVIMKLVIIMTMILRHSLDGNVPHVETEKYAWCELESNALVFKVKTFSE